MKQKLTNNFGYLVVYVHPYILCFISRSIKSNNKLTTITANNLSINLKMNRNSCVESKEREKQNNVSENCINHN